MSSWGQGGSRNWRRTRQQVLDRDRYECQLRYEGCTFTAMEVHHRVSVAASGLGRRDAGGDACDCIAVCQSCHRKITERQKRAGQQRANALRAQRKRLPQGPHPGERRILR